MIFRMLLLYLVVINGIAMITYGIDKRRAVRHEYRISEAALFLLALIGGSIGALLGMYVFHHKTRKMKFVIGIPAILILQIVVLLLLGKGLI